MIAICTELHHLCRDLRRFRFPFSADKIPMNGIYLLFEAGETGHGAGRIVRVGSHTGDNNLPSRLREHFVIENKDRSIFRKNIGRALLNREGDPFLDQWEWDMTSKDNRNLLGPLLDRTKQAQVEGQVTAYVQGHLSFAVLAVSGTSRRLDLESKLISAVSLCAECRPSDNWLGLHSTRQRICDSGLWQVQKLYKQPLSTLELDSLSRRLRSTHQ